MVRRVDVSRHKPKSHDVTATPPSVTNGTAGIEIHVVSGSREGISPFDSREDAINGVSEFIDYICAADPSIREALLQYKPKAA